MTKVAILAGGLGTRFAEETDIKPKPMIEIGGYPILWHIMKLFSCYGLNDFFIATGYKGSVIRDYFAKYRDLSGSIMVDLGSGRIVNYTSPPEDWRVHMIETGLETMTGGRILRMRRWLDDPEPFIVTYGDGLADVDINALLAFHKSHGKIATLTAIHPPSRFGGIELKNDQVVSFNEKPLLSEDWINGGFLVFNRELFHYLQEDSDVLEVQGLTRLAEDRQLMAFRHNGFWQCMDSLRDKRYLENLWEKGEAPWKLWENKAAVPFRRAA